MLRMQAKARKVASQMNKQMMQSESESDEEFFKAKENDAQSESEPETNQLPSLSKRKLRKINEQGPYQGKNILVFDSTGKPVPKPDLSSSHTN